MGKAKEDKNVENLVIPGNLLERVIGLVEKGVEEMVESNKEERETKESKMKDEIDFIKTQLKKVQTQMDATDITTEKYSKLVRVYDQLVDVIKYL